MDDSGGKSGELSNEEVGRRLVAARALRGVKQRDLQNEMQELDLADTQLSDYENGKKYLPRAARNTLAEILTIPRAWFYEPLERVIVWAEPKPSQLDRIEDSLEQLLRQLSPDAHEELRRLLVENARLHRPKPDSSQGTSSASET